MEDKNIVPLMGLIAAPGVIVIAEWGAANMRLLRQVANILCGGLGCSFDTHMN